MSERKKAQAFLLASLAFLLVSMITGKNAFFYVALGLLATVIVSDLIWGK